MSGELNLQSAARFVGGLGLLIFAVGVSTFSSDAFAGHGGVECEGANQTSLENRTVEFSWSASSDSSPGEMLIAEFSFRGKGTGAPVQSVWIEASPYFRDSGEVERPKEHPERIQSQDQKGRLSLQIPVSSVPGEREIEFLGVLFGKPNARLKIEYSIHFLNDEGLPEVRTGTLEVVNAIATVHQKQTLRF